jgi:hypothetical protein
MTRFEQPRLPRFVLEVQWFFIERSGAMLCGTMVAARRIQELEQTLEFASRKLNRALMLDCTDLLHFCNVSRQVHIQPVRQGPRANVNHSHSKVALGTRRSQ